MSTDDLPRLASAVKARRLALGLARKKAPAVAPDTWKRVEEGKLVRDMSYAAIDAALGWAVGSCASIKAGGSPVVAELSSADPAVTIADVSDSARAAAARRVVSATIATTGLPVEETETLTERIMGDLKRGGIV